MRRGENQSLQASKPEAGAAAATINAERAEAHIVLEIKNVVPQTDIMITSEQIAATAIAITTATIVKAAANTIEGKKAEMLSSEGQTNAIVESTSRACTHGMIAVIIPKAQTTREIGRGLLVAKAVTIKNEHAAGARAEAAAGAAAGATAAVQAGV